MTVKQWSEIQRQLGKLEGLLSYLLDEDDMEMVAACINQIDDLLQSAKPKEDV